MSWNYRIGTYVFSYKETFPNNPKLAENEDERLFSIIEVYYDKKGNPEAYSDKVKPLADWEILSDLIGTVDLVKLALSKPIIDLNDFPNEWHPCKISEYDEDGHVSNLEVWDWVVTKDKRVVQLTDHDMTGLSYTQITRHATNNEIKAQKD